MKKIKTTARKNKKDIFVSAVLVARSDSKLLAEYVTKLFRILDKAYTNYEIVVVDNGVDDREFDQVTRLLGTLPCIRVIKLSQQFKYDTAVFAGLEVAIGDYVCTLDASIDPPESLPVFIERNKDVDVIQGVSEIPVTGVMGSSIGRRIFYWYNRKYLGIDIPLNATYFASYTRRAVNSLTASSRSHRYMRHLARRVGYGYATQSYIPLQNPSNQRRLRTGVVEALEIVTSYSTHPL
jgi:glycosyltransferase involved in cell wall biosynthesis